MRFRGCIENQIKLIIKYDNKHRPKIVLKYGVELYCTLFYLHYIIPLIQLLHSFTTNAIITSKLFYSIYSIFLFFNVSINFINATVYIQWLSNSYILFKFTIIYPMRSKFVIQTDFFAESSTQQFISLPYCSFAIFFTPVVNNTSLCFDFSLVVDWT